MNIEILQIASEHAVIVSVLTLDALQISESHDRLVNIEILQIASEHAVMVSISQDVELHIHHNYAWSRLPPSVKAVSCLA